MSPAWLSLTVRCIIPFYVARPCRFGPRVRPLSLSLTFDTHGCRTLSPCPLSLAHRAMRSTACWPCMATTTADHAPERTVYRARPQRTQTNSYTRSHLSRACTAPPPIACSALHAPSRIRSPHVCVRDLWSALGPAAVSTSFPGMTSGHRLPCRNARLPTPARPRPCLLFSRLYLYL